MVSQDRQENPTEPHDLHLGDEKPVVLLARSATTMESSIWFLTCGFISHEKPKATRTSATAKRACNGCNDHCDTAVLAQSPSFQRFAICGSACLAPVGSCKSRKKLSNCYEWKHAPWHFYSLNRRTTRSPVSTSRSSRPIHPLLAERR